MKVTLELQEVKDYKLTNVISTVTISSSLLM